MYSTSSLETVNMSDGKVQSKKYELVAPDGGWGYVIFVAFIINISTSIIFFSCFGMLFNDFMIEIEMNSTGVTLLTGINAFCFAISGFFTDSLLKLMSQRKLAMLSALLLDAGMVGMVFAKSTITFIFFQGVLPGIAMGITYNLNSSIMNDYFVKKRVFAFCFVKFFIALLTMVAPLFVKWSLEEYGFRGTLALIAGLTFNNIFGVLLMQPVKWHMKRVEILVTEESQPILIEEKSKPKINELSRGSVDCGATIEKVDNPTIYESDKPSKLRKFLEVFVDVSFLKKFILSCVCNGLSIACFAESTFAVMLPQALYAIEWNQDMVAFAISLYNFGDMAMRTVFIFASKWMLNVGSQEIYIAGLVLATVSRLGFIWSETAIPIYVFIVLIGMARSFIYVLVPVVISEAVEPSKYMQAMGIFMLVSGMTTLGLGPVIGAVRDLTDSYSIAIYIFTACFAIMALIWIVEIFNKNNVDKSTRQSKTSTKSCQLNKI